MGDSDYADSNTSCEPALAHGQRAAHDLVKLDYDALHRVSESALLNKCRLHDEDSKGYN